MVVGEIFSETQGPENLQNRSQLRQKPRLVIGWITARQPVSYGGERLMEKGKCRLGAVQAVGPAAKCGGIRHAVRVFERRRCFSPRSSAPQSAATRPDSVPANCSACRGERTDGEKGEGFLATGTATAPDPDPIVVFIVRLFAAVSMADDRIALANRASPQDDFGAARGPIRFELVRRDAKWDKQNRTSLELCPGLTCQDLSRKRSSFLLTKIQLKENNPY